ncbi:hypothetical protein GCM10009531_73660 [Actinoplanes capillaceus]
MRRRHNGQHSEVTAMLAAVASESLPYTDPRACYPAAVDYRATRTPESAPVPAATRQATGTDEM